MGGIKRPPTEGLSLPHCIWLRLDHQFCFHGFSWFLYNTSSCNRWADCHSSLLGLAEDHPPMFEQARGWMPNGKLQTAKLCTKQALARSNTIQEISCDYSSKMWFMRKEPQSSFVSVCVESSQMWVKHSLSHTHLQVEPSLRLPLHCWLAWKLTQERQQNLRTANT